jgi:hypothetical protein
MTISRTVAAFIIAVLSLALPILRFAVNIIDSREQVERDRVALPWVFTH